MKKFLSRYSLRYPSSLVYMLQQSEYRPRDYLDWLKRTKNFSRVIKRKELKKTSAAKVLLAWVYLKNLAILGIGVLFFIFLPLYLAVILSVLLLFAGPFILAYGLVIVIWLGDILIQKPRVGRANKQTQKILSKHQAVRIAIAGSYGKTSMKDILKTVIGEAKKVAATPGNFNTPLGINRFVKDLDGDEDVLLFELGEYYPGDVKELARLVRPNVGIVTGVTLQHMARFKSLAAARDTIFELADYLSKKPLYVNGESEEALPRVREQDLLYSQEGTDGWKVSAVKTDLSGTRFLATKGSKKVQVNSQLLGVHQVGPLVAAIAIANHLGVDIAKIEKGINNTKPFEHRLQPLHHISGVVVIDDTYNGNLEGFKATIKFLAELKARRKVYVTPGIVEAGAFKEEIHAEIGEFLAQYPPDVVVLMRNSATPFIEAGLKAGGYKGELLWQEDPLQFYSNLQSFTALGDVIVLQNDWDDSHA